MMTKPSQKTRWVQAAPETSQHTRRLFCFPYAGGGASMYRDWTERLAKHIHVCPVQLPGRENRLTEPPYSRVQPVVRILAEQLEPYLNLPFAFFGYSMGALLAFELARELRVTHREMPFHLILAAHRAPQIPMRRQAIYHLDDEGFKEGLRHLEGTPEEVLKNDELMEIMLPRLRADFTLYETYHYEAGEALDVPMTVLGGNEDRDLPYEDLEDWRKLSRKSVEIQMIDGNHFFIHSSCDDVRGWVDRVMEQHIGD